MYFKADGSTIDGISGENFATMLSFVVSGNSSHLP
jgi:hypothetical protein